MEIAYINSERKKIILNNNGILIKDTNFHKYAYKAQSQKLQFGEILEQFEKEALKIPMLLYFEGTQEKREKSLETFHDIVSTDRIKNTPGKLYFNDWYLECFVLEEDIHPNKDNSRRTENEIVIYAPNPYWIKKKEYFLEHRTSDIKNRKKYKYKYPYRYATPNITYITNPYYSEVDFKMRIYGPCTNPSVSIGNKNYTVYTSAEKGERIEIDTKTNTILKINSLGEKENIFHFREKGTEFFKKIQPGTQKVVFEKIKLDIETFEERSIPRWN